MAAVGDSLDSLGSEFVGSPFKVVVGDGVVAASTSSAHGIGLVHAVAGEMAYFTVQARDLAGNNRTTSGDAFTGILSRDRDGAQTSALPTYTGNGTYRFAYNSTNAGNSTLRITLGGDHVIHSPASVYVSPAQAHAPSTTAEGIGLTYGTTSLQLGQNFTVTAKDRYDNVLDRGGDYFLVRLDGPAKIFALMYDRGEGLYESFWLPPTWQPGQYRLTIALCDGYLTSIGGGLTGEYFGSTRFTDNPLRRSVDREIDVKLGVEVSAARWTGLVIPVNTSKYFFDIFVGGGGSGGWARLLVNGKVVIDADLKDSSSNGSLPLLGGVPYNATIEFIRMGAGHRTLQWKWMSPGINSREYVFVPATRLAPVARHIVGSPFDVTVS